MRVPSSDEVSVFWKSVMGVEGEYDKHNPAIRRWKRMFDAISMSEDDGLFLCDADWKKCLGKARSWKASGPDGIPAFFWKLFRGAAALLSDWWRHVSDGVGVIPQWFVAGRTVFIPKDGCEGRPDQFRPIACLNTAYKLCTAAVTVCLLRHVLKYGLLPDAQKALRPGRRGCLDALLVDRMAVEDAKMRRKDLSVLWVDFKKAFDCVPHRWIVRFLNIVRAPLGVQRIVRSLIPLWSTTFYLKNVVTGLIQYKQGIFQGDSLPPLLFCLSVAPISVGIESDVSPYVCRSCVTSHLFFVDDLKVYTPGRGEVEHAVRVVDSLASAVGMSFGVRKCAVLDVVSGSVVANGDIEYQDGAIRFLEEGE